MMWENLFTCLFTICVSCLVRYLWKILPIFELGAGFLLLGIENSLYTLNIFYHIYTLQNFFVDCRPSFHPLNHYLLKDIHSVKIWYWHFFLISALKILIQVFFPWQYVFLKRNLLSSIPMFPYISIFLFVCFYSYL